MASGRKTPVPCLESAPRSSISAAQPITTRVQHTDGVGIQPEPVPSMQGIEQLDKLDETRAVVIARLPNQVDLDVVALP